MRRMDRYNTNKTTTTSSRRDKNEELYKEVSSNVKYADISDVTNANAYDISNSNELKTKTSREDYHKLKEYTNIVEEPQEKKQLDEFNYLYKDKENKVYDINTVMEEAHKNRKDLDEEAKRKLSNTNYNILASLNKEELEKYREEKKERVVPPSDDELKEIIDTITTKTLAGDLAKETSVNLLSDLMATQALDKVAAQVNENTDNFDLTESKYHIEKEDNETLDKEKLEEVEKENKKEKEKSKHKDKIMDNADTDFYSKSMDLSTKDFTMSDEFDDAKTPFIVKLLIVIIVIALIAAAGFYIYMHYFK